MDVRLFLRGKNEEIRDLDGTDGDFCILLVPSGIFASSGFRSLQPVSVNSGKNGNQLFRRMEGGFSVSSIVPYYGIRFMDDPGLCHFCVWNRRHGSVERSGSCSGPWGSFMDVRAEKEGKEPASLFGFRRKRTMGQNRRADACHDSDLYSDSGGTDECGPGL